MDNTTTEAAGCPLHDNQDRRKTAKIASENNRLETGAHWVRDPALARQILRSKSAFQAGGGAEMLEYKNPEQAPVFFLDGQEHANKRKESLRFLSPKAVAEQHYTVMERVSQKLLEEFSKQGHAKLEDISFRLAVEVVGEILGLTNSNQAGKVRRIQWVLHASISQSRNTALSRSRPGQTTKGLRALL